MEESWSIPRSTEMRSWRITLLTQAALCLALYGAFRIGRPQEPRNHVFGSRRGKRSESLDLYFLSVRGGFWPVDEQAQLLQQMAKAAEFYNAKFVVNISELGEDDPLMQNATLNFSVQKIPWYTTTARNTAMYLSKETKKYFLKKIKIAYDKTLDIVGLDTGLLQDFPHLEQLKESGSDQFHWVQQILSGTDSKWVIVVGFHPLMICREEHAQKSIEFYDLLHQIFLKYGVSAYLSQQNCAGQHYNDGRISYLSNPGPLDRGKMPLTEFGNPIYFSERAHGFLLHRVTLFEIESYFINSAGMVDSISKIHQLGIGVM